MNALTRALRARGWHASSQGSLRHRAYALAADLHPWWDWGHRVMTLTGRDNGDFQEPRGRDLWYLPDTLRSRDRNPVTTYDYRDVAAYPEGEWKILDSQDGGATVVFGWWPGRPEDIDGRIRPASLHGPEIALLRRWLIVECWARGDWFGIRSRLYFTGLRAHVGARKPFACNQVPPRSSGGYSHWHCQQRRRHTTDHRYRNYTWPHTAGPVTYEPLEATR